MPKVNTPAPLIEEVPPQLIEFMESKLNTLAKWDLIQFFFRKPSLLGPAPKIASLTGRDLRRVEVELKDMAYHGLLDVQEKSGVKLYRLSSNPETCHLIEQFVRACDDRKFREAAIYHTVTKR